ncbi:MAG: hypothetical protein II670_11465 [Alphaproteobacteria bacterium]|nr:hypothetical protein [Alphaproteobacteria bacterium]
MVSYKYRDCEGGKLFEEESTPEDRKTETEVLNTEEPIYGDTIVLESDGAVKIPGVPMIVCVILAILFILGPYL